MKHLTALFIALTAHYIIITVAVPVNITQPIPADCSWKYYCLRGNRRTGKCLEQSAPELDCPADGRVDHIIEVSTCAAGYKKDTKGKCRKVWTV